MLADEAKTRDAYPSPLPAYQNGKLIGTLPHDFNPLDIRYDHAKIRPNDFELNDGKWIIKSDVDDFCLVMIGVFIRHQSSH